MRCIDADMLKRKYEEHKRLFCRNRIEFSTLSDKDKARVDELDNCIADILNAPTIEERKPGKWVLIDKDNRFFHPHMLKCSVCNNTLDMYGVNAGRGDANYCPNCGAKMEEGDRE